MEPSYKMSNLQLELLKIFSRDLPEKELLEIKQLLANYFSTKLEREAERIWDEKGLTNDDMDRWLKELS